MKREQWDGSRRNTPRLLNYAERPCLCCALRVSWPNDFCQESTRVTSNDCKFISRVNLSKKKAEIISLLSIFYLGSFGIAGYRLWHFLLFFVRYKNIKGIPSKAFNQEKNSDTQEKFVAISCGVSDGNRNGTKSPFSTIQTTFKSSWPAD